MAFRDAFRRRLRAARIKAGMKQHHVAAALGISMEAYGRLERGETGQWVDKFDRVAKAVGTTPADLCAYHSGQGRKKDRLLELRKNIFDLTDDLTREDLLALQDQITATLNRRRRR